MKVMKTDVHLQRDVLDELDWDSSVDAAQIGVTAKEGVVTLTGHVPVYSQKHAAQEVAQRVHGVRAVANEIQVRPEDEHVRDDEDIAAAAVHALAWDAAVPDDRIQVVVEEGWLKLAGMVEHQYQMQAAERAVRHLRGVRGVENAVNVSPPAMSEQLKAEIEAAMRRNAALSARELSVEIDGNTVVLTGDAHSHSELQEALRIASSAPGVEIVKNCITVTPWGFGPAEEWGY